MLTIPFQQSGCGGFCKRRVGFTLVETSIAVALLGLVLAGAFTLLTGSFAVMRRTQESLYANRLLETAIEMTRNLSFADIEGDVSGTPAGYAAASPVTFSTNSSLLTGTNGQVLYSKGVPETTDPQTAMSLTNGTGKVYFTKVGTDRYTVTAAVTYTPFRRSPITTSVTTYIARTGVNRR